MLVNFYEAERIPDFGRNLSPMHTFFVGLMSYASFQDRVGSRIFQRGKVETA